MFASLVVILPTKHKGGSLLFRYRGREFSFDSADAVVTEGGLKAAFVVFYSDVEHEVSVVESGYRVTLTYNLYFSDHKELAPIPPSSPLNADAENRMKSSLEALLNDPKFLPDGGVVVFGLSHKYPFKNTTQLSALEGRLKGTDALLKQIWEEVFPEIDLELKALYRGDDQYSCLVLVDKFVQLGSCEMEDGLTDYLVGECRGRMVYTDSMKKKNPGLPKYYPDARFSVWVTPMNNVNQFKELFAGTYGNGPSLGHTYGDICLVAEIKGAEGRGLGAPNVASSAIEK